MRNVPEVEVPTRLLLQLAREYALGQPKTVQIDDAGAIRQIGYAKVGDLAVFEGDIVIGDANQIDFNSHAGPIMLYRQTSAGQEITPFGYIAKSVLSNSQKWTNKTVPYVVNRASRHRL